MSIDTCRDCGAFVDTDAYPDAFDFGDFCVCENCADARGEELFVSTLAAEAEDERRQEEYNRVEWEREHPEMPR